MNSPEGIPEEAGPDRFEEQCFKEHLLKEGYAASTARSYARSVEKLISWARADGLGPGELRKELGYRDLIAWAKELKAKSYTPKTVNGYLTAVRHWMAWLKDRGLREDNPAKGLKVRGERRRVHGHLLDEDELAEIYRSHPRESLSERRDQVLTGLVAFQALRRGELEALRPENLDLEAGIAHVPEKGRGEARRLQLRTGQIAPLMEYLEEVRPQLIEEALEAGGERPDALLTSTGKGTGLGNVLQLWTDRLRDRHPKVESAWQIRASRIAGWIRAHGLRKAQYKAGHAHISSTERYREADLEGLKASVERHHPLQ